MTLLSRLFHSSPMCHVVLSVASAPSLHTAVFLFLDPTVLLTHPMTIHMPFPITHGKNTSQFLHMSAQSFCNSSIVPGFPTFILSLLGSCLCELSYLLLRQPQPVLGTHSEHKPFHISIGPLFLSDLKFQNQIYHCTPQCMSPVLCTHWALQLDG